MFHIYRFLTIILFPVFIIIIYIRKFTDKEDSERFKEKIFTKKKVNEDSFIWFHGASIGEVKSVIPLIYELIKKDKTAKVIITSVTVSSANIIKEEFKSQRQIYHQFIPLDVPHLVNNFLDNWKPKFIGFIDSEIWPNYIHEIKKRKINLALINARITNKSFRRWKFFNSLAKKTFSSFDICLASSKLSAEYLEKLYAKNIKYYGNLKFIDNKNEYEKLKENKTVSIKGKKIWCVASTHKGEEKFCISTHQKIKTVYQDLMTIIIPRHIERINEIYLDCKKLNIKTQILDENEDILNNTEILLVNSFGVLPAYYNLSKSVFIGKSLLEKFIFSGGQNPIEAALQGCKIYHGPFISNFKEEYEYLNKLGIAEEVNNINELSVKIVTDLDQKKITDNDNIKKINTYGKSILKNTIIELESYI